MGSQLWGLFVCKCYIWDGPNSYRGLQTRYCCMYDTAVYTIQKYSYVSFCRIRIWRPSIPVLGSFWNHTQRCRRSWWTVQIQVSNIERCQHLMLKASHCVEKPKTAHFKSCTIMIPFYEGIELNKLWPDKWILLAEISVFSISPAVWHLTLDSPHIFKGLIVNDWKRAALKNPPIPWSGDLRAMFSMWF